jgi:hypothetical protein
MYGLAFKFTIHFLVLTACYFVELNWIWFLCAVVCLKKLGSCLVATSSSAACWFEEAVGGDRSGHRREPSDGVEGSGGGDRASLRMGAETPSQMRKGAHRSCSVGACRRCFVQFMLPVLAPYLSHGGANGCRTPPKCLDVRLCLMICWPLYFYRLWMQRSKARHSLSYARKSGGFSREASRVLFNRYIVKAAFFGWWVLDRTNQHQGAGLDKPASGC